GLSRLPQAVDLDESERRRRIILISLLVGRQLVAIQAVIALASHHVGMSFEKLDPDGARYVLLVRDGEGHEILVELAEPETVVDQVGVRLAYEGLEAQRFSGECEKLQLAMGFVEDESGGGLVDLA